MYVHICLMVNRRQKWQPGRRRDNYKPSTPENEARGTGVPERVNYVKRDCLKKLRMVA